LTTLLPRLIDKGYKAVSAFAPHRLNMSPKDTAPRKSFEDLARELEADEDPAHFEETLRKIATKTPPNLKDGDPD
jgi:hypothetical protein